MTDNQVAEVKRRMIALADANRGCSLEEIAANAELVFGIWPDASEIGGVDMAALRGDAPITSGRPLCAFPRRSMLHRNRVRWSAS
jgi:hypothetical protein